MMLKIERKIGMNTSEHIKFVTVFEFETFNFAEFSETSFCLSGTSFANDTAFCLTGPVSNITALAETVANNESTVEVCG